MNRRCTGFTLIELLIVIVIIAILIALLLPAVQGVREAARLTQCGNNLKQLATATLHYHESLLKLPPATTNRVAGAPGFSGSQMSWMARILPYVEQQSIHDLIDWSDGATNVGLRTIRLPTAVCPSDSGNSSGGRTNYVACHGNLENAWTGTPPNHRGGVFINSSVSLANIRDGASNTIFASECLFNAPVAQDYSGNLSGYNNCKAGIDGPFVPNSGSSGRGSSWIWGHSVESWGFTTAVPPNDLTFIGKKECVLWSTHAALPARSAHIDLVEVAFYDGSVRKAIGSIDINTWRRLGAIADGESASLDW
jgi:prepilin-type N-terminal cleavage/methylation domain-containing protein